MYARPRRECADRMLAGKMADSHGSDLGNRLQLWLGPGGWWYTCRGCLQNSRYNCRLATYTQHMRTYKRHVRESVGVATVISTALGYWIGARAGDAGLAEGLGVIAAYCVAASYLFHRVDREHWPEWRNSK